MDETTKIPPYVAYTRPNSAGCKVGTMPYTNKIKPPIKPKIFPLCSRNHFQTKYPPPISNNAAKKKTASVVTMTSKPFLLF